MGSVCVCVSVLPHVNLRQTLITRSYEHEANKPPLDSRCLGESVTRTTTPSPRPPRKVCANISDLSICASFASHHPLYF